MSTSVSSPGEATVSPEYLTPYQVAQMSGFTPKALETMRALRKGPPYFKVGRRVRYRASDIRAWIEGGLVA